MKTNKNNLSRIRNISATLLVLIALSACTKNGTTGTGKLTYKFNAVNSGVVKTSSSNLQTFSNTPKTMSVPTGINWTAGYLYVSNIEFKALRDTSNIKYESNQLMKVDIFNLNTSLYPGITIPSGIYDKIKLEVEIGTPQTVNEPGVYLSGTYNNTPIIFAFDESGNRFEIEVEARKFAFDNTKNYNSLINFHLNLLLDGVSNADLDAATKTNGTIVINSTTNANIYSKAKENLKHLSDSDFEEKD